MVHDDRQNDPVEKTTQGRMLPVINMVLKLFGFLKDLVIVGKKLSTPQQFKNVACGGNPKNMSVGC
jgi:hypothetical protein